MLYYSTPLSLLGQTDGFNLQLGVGLPMTLLAAVILFRLHFINDYFLSLTRLDDIGYNRHARNVGGSGDDFFVLKDGDDRLEGNLRAVLSRKLFDIDDVALVDAVLFSARF